jgi:hypothetical protein
MKKIMNEKKINIDSQVSKKRIVQNDTMSREDVDVVMYSIDTMTRIKSTVINL